uniref:Uncharacterized protein n=1 Tax=Anguilla anguilla TaxID=7936 RepID=A0A0E9ULZ8_ANGAN
MIFVNEGQGMSLEREGEPQ